MAEPALKLIVDPQQGPPAWGADLQEPPHENPPESADESESWLISYADLMTLLVGFFIVLQSFSKIDAESFEQVKKETTKLFGGQYHIPFEGLSSDMKKVVEDLKVGDQVLFSQTDQGVEITFKGALFFDSGSVELRPEATALMDSLIPVISEKAKDFGIVVEGHTDSTPLSRHGPVASNWELSSVRACRILRMFEEKGFAPSKMKALGWGDTRPIVSNADEYGNPIPANQAQNRRVVIKILKDVEGL